MQSLNPYLHFDGNAEEAFLFYKSVFRSNFLTLSRKNEAPGMDNTPDGHKILHVALPVAGGILMGSDNCNDEIILRGNNISLSLTADNVEDGHRYYEALSAGGKRIHAFQKEFWGEWFGSVEDKFGITWLISCKA